MLDQGSCERVAWQVPSAQGREGGSPLPEASVTCLSQSRKVIAGNKGVWWAPATTAARPGVSSVVRVQEVETGDSPMRTGLLE